MSVNPSALTDCFSVVHMHLPLSSSDACVAAGAAIRAAEIQADAARHAGILTLWSGLAAFMAGLLAVGAAATDQVTKWQAARRHRQAYFERILCVFEHTKDNLKLLKGCFEANKSLGSTSDFSSEIFIVSFQDEKNYAYIVNLRDTLAQNNWVDMSLFPKRIISETFSLGMNLYKVLVEFAIIRDKSYVLRDAFTGTHRVTTLNHDVESAATAGLALIETIETQLEEIKKTLSRELKLKTPSQSSESQ